MPCWVDVTVPDPPAAAAFDAGVFGWDIEETAPGRSFVARLDGRDVGTVVCTDPEGTVSTCGSPAPGRAPSWSSWPNPQGATFSVSTYA